MVDRYAPHLTPLAIVGMGCRLPGADDLDQYWRLLVEGRSAVVELPPDRLDQQRYFDPEVGARGMTYSKLGAIISSRKFDRSRCPIDEKLARSADDAHLLMCDVAASALKHAGYDPFNLALRNTGVYIGHAQGSSLSGDLTFSSCMAEAAEFLREVPAFAQLSAADQDGVIRELVDRVRGKLPKNTRDTPDVSASLVAGTISKAFGLNGPYVAINSACASSLQAILLGARALQLGRVDMAIVGGASDCKGDTLVLFSNARAMSSTGTRPFDAEADGLVCGEGYGALVMKTLSRALADGDRVLAVVRGLGVSSDGKGKSLWAPRKEGQLKAMERAYRDGLDISQLDYLEAHATATKLGDATELNTLKEILSPHFPPGKRIPITSVKANIGHALETAGIAGVIKTVLAMHHDTIPPAINIRQINPNIDWDNAPVYVPTAPVAWPKRADGKPRRAGINAFGIGGLNMHAVLDEFNESARSLAAALPGPPQRRLSAEDEAIAVIGLGCVLPGAENPTAFWQLLAAGTDPKSPVPRDRWRPEVALKSLPCGAPDPASLVGGFITNFEYDWKRHKVPPKQVQQADPLQFMLLEAADQAMQDAGYHQREFNRENVGVVVGTEFGGDFSFQLQLGLRLPELAEHIEELLTRKGLDAAGAKQVGKDYAEVLLRHWPALIDETGSFSTSSLASRIGKTWNLMGGAAAIDAGQVSGMAALSISVDMLLAGDCDLMICAAGQRRMAWPMYEGLLATDNLARTARSPLDASAQGSVPAEGVVVVLLKRLADARRDGDRVHAVLRGLGGAHDASSWGHALQLAMERSFGGGTRPSDVALMELDAHGAPPVTAEEVRAVATVYGQDGREKPLMVSSILGQLGNTQGASSLVSLLKAILEISHGELPPSVALETPAPVIAENAGVVQAPAARTAIDLTTTDGRRLAAVGTCSRGLAYHAILEYGEKVQSQPPAPTARSVAAAPAPVAQAVQAPIAAPAASSVNLADLEKFLINFVVEQTGYPPEVVELDADLEADLGIDSIKKAQMFGELQEYFDVTPTDNLTLDDFPTLRHIVNFLATVPQKGAAPTPAPVAAQAAPQAAPAPAMVATPAPTPVATASRAAVATARPAPAAPGAVAAQGAPTSSWHVCRFGAADPAALRRLVEAASQDAAAFEASSRRRFSQADCMRLAVVADSSATLATKLAMALKQMENSASQTVLEQQGIFYREARPDTRIAFLFPGQGSQYTGMLRQLVADVPAARAHQQHIDEVMTRLGFPTWEQLAWEESSPLGKDVWTTQISMLLADLLVLAALKDRNILPDLVAGHSYGEYAALYAAGAWDLEQAVRVTRRRCESIQSSAGKGGMLATTATPETIDQMSPRVSGPVYVANHNAPDQTVVGGTLAALAELEKMLQTGLFETRMLPVPSPFHTPLMREAAELFRQHLAGETFVAPRVTTYSVATNEAVREPGEIGFNLVSHLTTPVRYADLIRKLASQAPTVFVEVGPQQALSRLNRRIVAAAEFAGIACDNPARPGVEQLVRVQALLECTGALDRDRRAASASSDVAAPIVRGQVWHFDATARRRDKMRQSAGTNAQPASSLPPAPAPRAVVAAVVAPTAPSPAPRAAVPPPAPAQAPKPAPAAPSTVNLADLEKFLINFVVEQTGYPPEVVELDADLEADLGIDSIKKAQMFGELQEYFDVTPTDNLTLDDFPTLRHIVNFLAGVPQKGAAPTAAPAPVPVPAPAPVVAAAPTPAPTQAPAPAAAHAVAASVDISELEKFLINFVVEQTGYPPEVIELDADLEADLGIDSIKKAQMFGELQEYFDVTPTDNLTLDDFPTLRHIVNFLAGAPQKGATPPASAPAAEPVAPAALAASTTANAAGMTAASDTPHGATKVDVLHVRGTPYEMGYQQGLEKKTEIRLLLRRIADLTDGDFGQLPIAEAARHHPERFFTPEVWDELQGMARAVEVPLGNLAALNLAVLTELADNAAQVAVIPPGPNGSGVLHAIAAELFLPPALAEMLSPLVLVREPAKGLACATVTFAGIVGSLVGINTSGLAASAGALLDATAGSNGASADSSTLRVDSLLANNGTIDRAADNLRSSQAARGWTALLSQQGQRRVRAAEFNGTTLAEHNADHTLVATNHCVLHVPSSPVPPSSLERLQWLQSRLASPRSVADAGELLALLAELPSHGMLRIVAVVDAAHGDLLLDCGELRERVHVGALLPASNGEAAMLNGASAVAGSNGSPLAKQTTAGPAVSPPSSADLDDRAVDDVESLRFTLRMVPTPWATEPADFPAWKGPAAVCGDNPLAQALCQRLHEGGATVVRLRQSQSIEAALNELEQAWQQQPIAYLFMTSHRDEASLDRRDPAQWDRVTQERILLPYFLYQRYMQLAGDARRIGDCTVVAATDLGGDLGFSGNVPAPESGFTTGLLKSLLLEYAIMREHKGFIAKAIDAPPSESPAELAANIFRELAHGSNDYEVSFVGGRRYLQVALPEQATLQTHSRVRPGGNWVLTGGARGITAECGLALGRRFGLKLHLIGTTPADPIDPAWRDLDEKKTADLRTQIILQARKNRQKPNEAWAKVAKTIEMENNLRAFATAGVRATYHACDVSDRGALARVLDEVRSTDGPIDGILHGAGIEQSCRYEKKTRETVLATVGSKVLGAYNLMHLTRGDPVRHFIGFGSVSGRLGSNGQTDYAAASDMLCKLMGWYRGWRPEVHAVGFHFHPWGDVGMASRPETESLLKASKLRLMAKETGLRHLLRELYTSGTASEVLITDLEYHQRYYPKNYTQIAARSDLLGAPGSKVPQVGAPAPRTASTRVADRVVLRMADAPLAAGNLKRPLPEAALLVGHNADADALAAALSGRGVKVVRLPLDGNAEAVCAALARLYEQSPIGCLILATARDPEAANLGDRASAERRIERGVYLPFWVARTWFQLVSKHPQAAPATLVALASLGGQSGFSGPVPSPEGGALSGLLKSVFVEDARHDPTRFQVKVIDLPADEPPAQVAESVCQELESNRPEVEVGWSRGNRRIVSTVREPIESRPLGELPRGGVWVITGGARGITAATALELGRRYGLTLHLLGKSPAPDPNAPWRNCSEEQLKAIKTDIVRAATQEGRTPESDWDRVKKDREIQTSLDKFTSAGVRATYHACDVADWDDLDRALREIRAQDGPIEGIIHGAGYARSFRFGTGSAAKIQATIAPKVDGTLALMHLTQSDPLRYFVGFGSLSGRFGGNGLSDYAAANDMLAKLCGWFRSRRPECHTTCFHWQTWDQVGMAMMADGVGITKNAFKMDFIPPEEGVAHLIDELRAGAPEPEVLVTDGFFQRQFYPYDFETPPPATSTKPATLAPLVAAWQAADGGTGVARIVFDPVGDPFLSQHRLKQKPFLPGVIGMESLVEAAAAARDGLTIAELRNVRIENGMAFHSDNPLTARVEVTPGVGGLVCRMLTEQRDRQGRLIDAARLHVEGFVPAAADTRPIEAEPASRPPLGWFPHDYPDEGLLYHGPSLRCLKGCSYQYDGGWGRIVAPPLAELAGPRGAAGWVLPAAVLDACLVTCSTFVFIQFGGVIEVPYGFDRLRLSRMPREGEELIARVYFRERGERHSRFDFTVYGDDDQPLIQAVNYRTIRVGGR